MAGSGTKEDPWLIEDAATLTALLRDSFATGYYRLTGDMSISLMDGGIASTSAATYRCKVIDAQGYKLTVSATGATGTGRIRIAGVMFVNCHLILGINASGDYLNIHAFYNCFFTDCLVMVYCNTGFSRSYTFGTNAAGWVALEEKVFRRLIVINGYTGTQTQFEAVGTLAETTFVDVFKWSANTGSWYTRLSSAPAIAVLGSAVGQFVNAGWFDDASLGPYPIARPFFADVIEFQISTLVDGEPVARELMYEANGQSWALGVSDAGGELAVSLRVRRFLTLRIVATESYGLDRMQNGNYVQSGRYYLPPVDNGWKYQASAAGQLTNLQSVSFGSTPAVVNGITLTPFPVYPEMASPRTTLLTGGAQQIVTLDTADLGGGGGGPVLEGDPAYLDGVVEEIHPLLGTARPLANAEVVVVELRADQSYAPMGRALSNPLGEFRVNTEVYGGGDVFAFAVDFPGFVWQAGAELGLGARVRPPVNNGYVYEVVVAGTAGSEEPQWWADEGDGTEGYIGTARAKAKPYYQPQAHGPLKMTFVTP